jgi:phospholipid/cholesterol/gamma-HCH transport system substrate-binding protein
MDGSRGKEIRVGALIALGFLIIFGAFFIIGGQEGLFKKKIELRAKFTNVEGLTVGAAVRLGVVKVGSVDHVGFSSDGSDKRVVVRMAVNTHGFNQIRKDSMAKLGGQGLLGDRTVDITIGTPSEPPLNPGDFINTVETAQLTELISQGGDVMSDLKTTARNIKEVSFKINSGTGSLAEIINDPRLYTDLDSLMNMWSNITLKIDKGEGFLAMLINDPGLYHNLVSSLTEIDTFMANVNSGKGSLGKLVTEEGVYNRIESLLTAANATITKVNSGNGTASQVINSPNLYQRIDSTLSALNELIVDIKVHPKRYVKLSIF